MTLPKNYLRHKGGGCPVDPEQFVDCIVRTAEGFGHSGVMRAKLHEWRASEHPDGIGAVVGYRLSSKAEILPRAKLLERWE